MTDGYDSEASADLDAVVDQAWGMLHAILDETAEKQRGGLLRRKPRLVSLDGPLMESMRGWWIEFLFPPDEEWRAEWDDDPEPSTSLEEGPDPLERVGRRPLEVRPLETDPPAATG